MKVDKNKFDLSRSCKLSCEAGFIIPTMVQDVLPGDSFRINTQNFVRVAPMVAPIMARMNIRNYYFFVPLRIIWNDAEEFFTRGRDQDSTITVPRIPISQTSKAAFIQGQLPDYMGIPPTDGITVSGTHYISALPFRAYLEIWNEYFRNQEVQDEVVYPKTSADADWASGEITELCTLRLRNWDKDYFTGAKKEANLLASVNGYVEAEYTNDMLGKLSEEPLRFNSENSTFKPSVGAASFDGLGDLTDSLGAAVSFADPIGINIEEIRRVSAMKRWMETLIRSGYRYIDYLSGLWGVKSSDSRFQRPEFLGGSSQPIRISEVLNTSDTANAPQGAMSGHALSSGESPIINFTSEEHGYLLCLQAIVPEAEYFQGIAAHWMKFDHLDFANPLLANLGAQETPSSELYHDWADSYTNNMVNFGYKPRYAEYKTALNTCHGNFRNSLAYWHMGRAFVTRPSLESTFLQCDPKKSAFAVTTGHHYYCQIYHKVSCLRKLPYYAVPVI